MQCLFEGGNYSGGVGGTYLNFSFVNNTVNNLLHFLSFVQNDTITAWEQHVIIVCFKVLY